VAGENARARTTDANPGGEAYWIANGDTLKVCDIQHDGWGAYAEARHCHARGVGVVDVPFFLFARLAGGPLVGLCSLAIET
jgi:hypothetical protein